MQKMNKNIYGRVDEQVIIISKQQQQKVFDHKVLAVYNIREKIISNKLKQ